MIRRGLEGHWQSAEPSEIPDPFRDGMPNDAVVVFTRADLHPSDIMTSKESLCTILAVIDWQQSGWYPDYWEFRKTAYTAEVGSE